MKKRKKRRLKTNKTLFIKNMRLVIKSYIFLAVLLVLGGGFLSFYIYWQLNSNLNAPADNAGIEADDSELVMRKLDGVLVEPGRENLLPVAVMIENHIDSRPPSGLAEAKVVYEVLTEASITRFLAIYDLTEELEKIGPVRSARPYFVNLAGEYGGMYVHSGGSPAAIDQLAMGGQVTDLNEFFGYNSGYFWRDRNRYSPHNLFTSTELLAEAKSDLELGGEAGFSGWQFSAQPEFSGDNVSVIDMSYSFDLSYQLSWRYDEESGKYWRYQSGDPHLDDQERQITADNLIIQFAQHQILDNVGRKDIFLGGEGEALFFINGYEKAGFWRKDGTQDRTFFYDEDGNEIIFKFGNIWVEIAPIGMNIGVE